MINFVSNKEMFFSIINKYINILFRLPQSYGFGVQSPSAFSFIRDVVNEDYPYYAYQEMDRLFPKLDSKVRKLNQFYFRLVNYAQLASWIDFNHSSEELQRFIPVACNKTIYQSCSSISDFYHFDIVRIKYVNKDVLNQLLNKATPKSILIVEEIYSSKLNKDLWKSLILDNRISTTFDLLDCGLVFFDKRPKQHYKLFLK